MKATMKKITILLLALICTFSFSACLFNGDEDGTSTTTTSGTTGKQIAVTGFGLQDSSQKNIVFTEASQSVQLSLRTYPIVHTEDVVFTFSSSDEGVALVSKEGVITPNGNGKATITIYYMSTVSGEYWEVTVDVTCRLDGYEDAVVLSRNDVTIKSGKTYDLTNIVKNSSQYDKSKFTVIIEEGKEDVLSVNGTVLTAGTVENTTNVKVTIYYNYGSSAESSAECTIRVAPSSSGSTTGEVKLSHDDVTINLADASQSDKFTLSLKDADGNVIKEGVEWNFGTNFNDYCSKSESNGSYVITGHSAGTVTIKATYNGKTYTCVVRVKA